MIDPEHQRLARAEMTRLLALRDHITVLLKEAEIYLSVNELGLAGEILDALYEGTDEDQQELAIQLVDAKEQNEQK